MKKIILMIALMSFTITINAQWTETGDNKTVGSITSDSFLMSRNPDNKNASLALSWLNNISRLRLGGSGEGVSNGFELQGVSDKKLLRIDNSANAFVYGNLDLSGALNTKMGEGFKIFGDINYFGKYLDGIVFQMEDVNASNGNTDGGFIFRGHTTTDDKFKEWMVIKSGGNVGIGIASPKAKLHINNGDNSYGAILGNATEAKFSLYTKTLATQPANIESFRLGMKYDLDENNGFISFYRGSSSNDGFLGFSTSGKERMRIDKAGNVDIGTKTSGVKLEVKGYMRLNTGTSDLLLYRDNDVGNWSLLRSNVGEGIAIIGQPDRVGLSVSRNTSNVGIGTTDTKGFKLGVNGKIAATEVKVATYANWPDYVFAKEYNLSTLSEVENQINEKGHLADIPSAEEVKKDGFFLGKMDAKLLQKIEELTLYIIQQEKEIEDLKVQKERIDKLEAQNKELVSMLTKLINNK